MLEDLYKVGKAKPLAYETQAELAGSCGHDLQKLAAELAAAGRKILLLSDRETVIYSGALYVYDEEALAFLLAKRAAVLRDAGLPATPEAFVRAVAARWIPEKTALFDLIADAFGDKEHPGRTDVRVPDEDARYQPAYLAMLREKERLMRQRENSAAPPPGGPSL